MMIPLPQAILNDYLMSRSVMDEPRALPQQLLDFFFGRTYPEQLTNAFTGAVGLLKPESHLLPYMKGALDLLPLRVRALLERSPKVINVVGPRLGAEGIESPGRFWSTMGGGGDAVIDVKRILDPEWFGGSVNKNFPDQKIIEAAIAHELSHGANKIAFGNAGATFPGVSASSVSELTSRRPLREIFPLLVDQGVLRRGEGEHAIITNLQEALKGLEGFYSDINPVSGLGPLPLPPVARQVKRAAARKYAE